MLINFNFKGTDFICMCVCAPAAVSVCHVCAGAHADPERVGDGAVVTGRCEPLHPSVGTQAWVLCKSSVCS